MKCQFIHMYKVPQSVYGGKDEKQRRQFASKEFTDLCMREVEEEIQTF